MKAARLVAALLMLALAAPATSTAGADVQAGFVVTIEAPAEFTPGTTLPISGNLFLVARVPLVLEFAHGIADEEIDLLVNGASVATTTTADDGSYTFNVPVDHTLPPELAVMAVAMEGRAYAETRSRTVVVTSTHVLTEFMITPADARIGVGETIPLLAEATYSNGRPTEDVTATVIWSSSDDGVASVSNDDASAGVVTGNGPGTATITAALYGRTATATIVVG